MKYLPIIFFCIFSVACASGGGNESQSESAASESSSNSSSSTDQADTATTSVASATNSAGAISIQTQIPYSKNNRIARNIKEECGLETSLPNYLVAAVGNIKTVKKLSKSSKGKVLIIEITDAISSGNAFIGHRKSATVTGTLYKNGKKVASFTAGRISGGGMWGGFKGSCSVLNRIMKVVAKDISKWLDSPVDGARLGDA